MMCAAADGVQCAAACLLLCYAPQHHARSRQLQVCCSFACTLDVASAARCTPYALQIPKNQALVAVPLFELHDSAAKFGSVISGVPVMLSRLR